MLKLFDKYGIRQTFNIPGSFGHSNTEDHDHV